jgi:Fe-S oxidoreductase
MFRHNFAELFEGDSIWLPRAKALAARTYEFTEYLVDQLGVTDVGAKWDGLLTYHPSCHTLRGINVDKQPRALLSNVQGALSLTCPMQRNVAASAASCLWSILNYPQNGEAQNQQS